MGKTKPGKIGGRVKELYKNCKTKVYVKSRGTDCKNGVINDIILWSVKIVIALLVSILGSKK